MNVLNLDTKIPPPLIMLSAAAFLWLATPTLRVALPLPDYALTWPALVLFLGGVAIDLISLFYFVRARTTVNPLNPEKTSVLVTSGLYRFSRNPMYLGMLLWLLALCLYLNNIAGLLVAAAFVAYINRFQIRPEERALQQQFGEAYERYQQQVPRWLLFK